MGGFLFKKIKKINLKYGNGVQINFLVIKILNLTHIKNILILGLTIITLLLKGSSIFTLNDIKRVSFRNFYKPNTRYILSGGRLCA